MEHLWGYGPCQQEAVFQFVKKTQRELTRTVSVAKSEVGWHLSGEDEQWERQGRAMGMSGAAWDQASPVSLALTWCSFRSGGWRGPAQRRLSVPVRPGGAKEREAAERGDAEPPSVGRQVFQA